jgi:hypothetical protein
MLVHFGRLSDQGRQWYSLSDAGRYTLADYEWYSLADAAWYIIVRLMTALVVYQVWAIVLVVLALAVGNGEVKLDDPISMYLPEGVTAPGRCSSKLAFNRSGSHTLNNVPL